MKKLAVTLAVIGVFVLLVEGADAEHYEYLVQDPAKQEPAEGIEPWAFRWWTITTIPKLYWWADAALRTDAVSAISSWTAIVPEMEYLEVSAEVTADVVFKAGSCPNSAPACSYNTDHYFESDRDASYWIKNTINVDFSENWSADGRRAAVAHELGHIYGLHERYQETPQDCNASETTIMDALVEVSGYLFHCDFLTGPVSIDDSRVTSYWSDGAYSSFAGTPFGTAGLWAWKNDAWTPRYHRVYYYWYDPSTGWVNYEFKAITADIGVPRVTEDRIMSDLINRLSYPIITGPGWHVACGYPKFEAFDEWGDWVCSNQIYLW